jgi:hypothetical protein
MAGKILLGTASVALGNKNLPLGKILSAKRSGIEPHRLILKSDTQ